MSEPGNGPPPQADPADEALTKALLLLAAQRYEMTTDVTDWDAVSQAATRARRAMVKLELVASDRPLRAIPPRRP